MIEPVFVIVGAGLAGSVAAETLRNKGFDGRVVLVGEEPDPPYSRPPLSKGVLRGEQGVDEPMLRPEEFYGEQQIELELGVRATRVDPSAQVVELADGRRFSYDKVLLATGGRARRVAVPGADLPGVHTLRTIADTLAIRERLEPGAPVVVIGAGFIGAEVAASARMMGCDLTVLEVADVPLGRVLGSRVGAIYTDIHRQHGVNLRTATGVERIEEGGEGLLRVIATDGHAHEAAVVIVGVGIEPDGASVTSAGVEIGDGIVVNEQCETAVPGVYAAGDVAFHPNPILGRSVRIEQWQNAQHQAASAARNMLGEQERFAEVPWFWSDQYDLNLQMAGLPSANDHIVFRGDIDGACFSAFYLNDGVLDGVVGVNRVHDVRAGRRMIQQRLHPSPEQLADASVSLAELAGSPARR